MQAHQSSPEVVFENLFRFFAFFYNFRLMCLMESVIRYVQKFRDKKNTGCEKGDILCQKIIDCLKGKSASEKLKIGDAVYSKNLLCERGREPNLRQKSGPSDDRQGTSGERGLGNGTFIRGSGQGGFTIRSAC